MTSIGLFWIWNERKEEDVQTLKSPQKLLSQSHTGSFAQISFQIDLIIGFSTWKYVLASLTAKPKTDKLFLILLHLCTPTKPSGVE